MITYELDATFVVVSTNPNRLHEFGEFLDSP